jgi:hypothetical protein
VSNTLIIQCIACRQQCTSQLSCACVLHTPERSTRLKLLWYLQTAYPYHLAYNHTCMIEHDERARQMSRQLWIMQFWRPDTVVLAGTWPVIELSVLTFVEISCVRWSVMPSKRLVQPKSLLTKEFRLPFHRLWFLIRSVMNVEATLHERVYLTANPNENWSHNGAQTHQLNTLLSMAILTRQVHERTLPE